MVKKCALFLLGLFAIIQVSTAQVVVKISDDATDVGGTVDMDVTFDNFSDIIAFQYSIDWDETKFSFNSIVNVTTDLDQFTAGGIGTPASGGDAGVITVSWSKTNTQPETLADNTRMFTLRLNAIGSACDVSDVKLSNTPTVIEFSDSNTNNVGATPENGEASINGTGCNSGGDDLVITVDDVTANSGDNKCVPITVSNFIDIQGVVFGVKFDPSIIKYTGFQNANLPDFSSGNIADNNSEAGEVNVLWFDNSVMNPVTLEGTLLELCFDAIGSGGDVSDVEIVDPATSEIEFTNSDENAVPYEVNQGSFTIEGMGNPNDFMLIADDININMGETGCVPISVANFNSIQTMQFVVKWDPTQLLFTEVKSLNLDQLSDDNLTLKDDDRIRISWSNASSATVADGTVIFEVCLEAKGDCDATSSIDFTSDPFFAIEVSNSSNDLVPVSRTSGSVKIDCDGCSIAIRSLEKPSCPGEADGNILVNVGSPGVTYNCIWKNSAGTVIQESSSCDLENVAAGTYTLEIDDGASCQETRTFTLEDPGTIVFGGSKSDEDESCDGSINLEMIGGTGPYTFLWENASTGAIRTELCAGEYCVTATDANGCVAETCFTINANGPGACNVEVTDNRCFGDDDGAIDIDFCGGTGPYTITWSGPSGDYTTEDISGLAAGDYNYTITDSSNPALTGTGSVTVGQPAEIMISSMTTASDGDNGAIDITVTGGVGPYSYVWSGGQLTEDISGLASATYTVMVTDENNCSVTSDPIQVNSNTINFVRTGEFDASCNGVCDGVIEGTVSGGSGGYTYKLNDSGITFPVTGLCPGDYTFEITDDSGESITYPITVGDPDPLTIEIQNKMNCTSGNQDGFIEVEALGGTPEYTFTWNVTGTGKRLSNLGDGKYNVLVTDARGCTAARENIQIICDGGECFTSRTIITPNGDGNNDEFIIMCSDDFANKLLVFDRWGKTVFSQDSYDNTWLGTNSNGDELPDGGYLWILEITNGDGSKEIKKGTVSIIRDQF